MWFKSSCSFLIKGYHAFSVRVIWQYDGRLGMCDWYVCSLGIILLILHKIDKKLVYINIVVLSVFVDSIILHEASHISDLDLRSINLQELWLDFPVENHEEALFFKGWSTYKGNIFLPWTCVASGSIRHPKKNLLRKFLMGVDWGSSQVYKLTD